MFSQRRLSANWLVLRENDYSRMYSKVSSGWVPGYIKAMRPILDILKWPDTFRATLVRTVHFVQFITFTNKITTSKKHQNNLWEHVGTIWWTLLDKEKCMPVGGQI